MNSVVRLEELSLRLDDQESLLLDKIAIALQLDKTEIVSYSIVKKNLDARHPRNILVVYSADVILKDLKSLSFFDIRHRVRIHEPYVYIEKTLKKVPKNNVVIVGAGPCGLFAALILAKAGFKPILIERGQDVDNRVKTVDNFANNGVLNAESNIQFGEGGAGTFSDGKLYTLINDPRSKYIFEALVRNGAPEEILISGTPHIGTDKLRKVVKSFRNELINLGVDIRFNCFLKSINTKAGKISSITTGAGEEIAVSDLILATGHSARDTYEMLYKSGLKMSPKALAIGLRIEHSAQMIKEAQYGVSSNHKKLGAAKYKLVQHTTNRSVYTFCMCPGGYVVPAASEPETVVVNGMSKYLQNGDNSNSALLVPVTPADFGSDHPLAGIEFLRRFERQAFKIGGENYYAPAQLVGDFLNNRNSTKSASILASYKPGVKFTKIDSCLPDYVIESIREAIPLLDKKLSGFANPEAVLTGVETRSSSPVRIERSDDFQSNILGIYPAGEGAGYAGGIVSSALDGIKVAEAIIDKYQK